MDSANPPPAAPPQPLDEPQWPGAVHTREELDAALEEGFASGASKLTHADIIAEARKALGLA